MTAKTAEASPMVKSMEGTSPDPGQIAGGAPGPVMLALHGQETSDAAGLAAYLLADRLRAGTKIVSVIEPMPSVMGPDGMPLVTTVAPETLEAREQSVRRRLSLVPAHEKKREIDVRFGQVAPEIVRAAADAGASVIVVDAAPHRRLRHTVSGRCASRVLRRTHTPVLSVAPAFSALPRRAIVAIDFSPASVAAARLAVRLLAENGVLTLLHIAPQLDQGRMLVGESADSIATSVNSALEHIREELMPLGPHGINIRMKVATGVVVSEILAAADELEAELIAVGTHGPGIVERFFVGSVAGTVLELAGTTVLAAPEPEKDESGDSSATSVSDEPQTWRTWLDEFSKRNIGRPVTVEVDDPDIGAQVQARGYLLQGTVCDPADDSIEIMLGPAPGGDAHLTRKIEDIASVAIGADTRGRDAALEIRHGEGRTLLVFKD